MDNIDECDITENLVTLQGEENVCLATNDVGVESTGLIYDAGCGNDQRVHDVTEDNVDNFISGKERWG